MKKSTIINFSVYAVLLLVLWLGLRPLLADSGELKAVISALKTSVNEEKEKLNKLSSLIKEIDAKEEELKLLELAVPPQRDIASIIAILEEASVINGLSLNKIGIVDEIPTNQPGIETKSSSVLGVFKASIELSGRYSSFRGFLKDMEKTFPLLDVSEVDFEFQEVEGLEIELDLLNPQLDFNVNLETYYRK